MSGCSQSATVLSTCLRVIAHPTLRHMTPGTWGEYETRSRSVTARGAVARRGALRGLGSIPMPPRLRFGPLLRRARARLLPEELRHLRANAELPHPRLPERRMGTRDTRVRRGHAGERLRYAMGASSRATEQDQPVGLSAVSRAPAPPGQADLFVYFQLPYEPPYHEWTEADQRAIRRLGAESMDRMGNDEDYARSRACGQLWLSRTARACCAACGTSTRSRSIVTCSCRIGTCTRALSCRVHSGALWAGAAEAARAPPPPATRHCRSAS